MCASSRTVASLETLLIHFERSDVTDCQTSLWFCCFTFCTACSRSWEKRNFSGSSAGTSQSNHALVNIQAPALGSAWHQMSKWAWGEETKAAGPPGCVLAAEFITVCFCLALHRQLALPCCVSQAGNSNVCLWNENDQLYQWFWLSMKIGLAAKLYNNYSQMYSWI